MFRSIKTLGAIVLLASLMLLGVGQQISQSLEVTCTNQEIRRSISPDGTYAAVLFRRDCGPETGVSTQVSIIDADRELNNFPGNVVATRDIAGGYWLTWPEPRTLEVADIGGEVIRQRTELGGITIRYRP